MPIDEDVLRSYQDKGLDAVPVRRRTADICLAAFEQRWFVPCENYFCSRLLNVPKDMRSALMYRVAVSNRSTALEKVPDRLRTEGLCRLAVSTNMGALKYVPKALRTEELFCAAISNDGDALDDVLEEFRIEELYRVAVSNNGWALRHMPD